VSTSSREEYDLVVLGSGEAGKYLAWTAAKQGRRAAVIERQYIGGSCPNIACLPSKNIIHSAKVASYFHRAAEFGIRAPDWEIAMEAVRERKRKMVSGLLDMHLENFQKSGAELVLGTGRFIGPKVIEVKMPEGDTRQLSGKQVVINTGTRARVDDTPGLAEASPLTHIEALELDSIPEHLIVLGGGYIGLELSQAMRRFGSRVTVLERNERLVHSEDDDVTEALQGLFLDEGIEVLTGTHVTNVEGRSGQTMTVYAEHSGEKITIHGTHLLAATGRLPNTEGIGLEVAGVDVTERGHVKVNERLETTAPDIWAVGDCAGSPYFTHIGYDDFRIVRDNWAGDNRTTTGRQVPYCMFTDPELARVGLSEKEAKARGASYRLAKVPMAAALRTRTLGETRGFMKALVEPEGDRILGFTAFGTGAGDLLAPVQIVMQAGLPFTTLRDTIFTHPTMPEGLIALFGSVPARVT
jgi:pyruvate/2-oxoglutarate dehydrogenase complex dihydrolipoamide dehydrogenase (E3) component